MPEYQLYNLKVSVVTPLHIGNGVDLLHEYDYAIHNGRTWRINETALLDAQDVDDPALASTLARTPPARLLKAVEYKENSPLFRYVIQGTPRSSAEGAQVQEQIKNIDDQLYLPGSSLKGALRTSLAWFAWGKKVLKAETRKLDRRRQWAAKRYEQEIFGRDPNHDLLRALHVADSHPVEAERLLILNVRVLNRDGKLSAPIELEAVRPDTVFEVTVKIDQALFSEWAKKHRLSLQGAEWLANLTKATQEHARQRIKDEVSWYKQIRTAGRLLSFYQQLDKLQGQLGESSFFLQLAWGTGWGDKTFGSHLQADRGFMERAIKDYRLTRGSRQHGDPFPKSRRVAVSIPKSPQGQIKESAAYPLGWVLVEMSANN